MNKSKINLITLDKNKQVLFFPNFELVYREVIYKDLALKNHKMDEFISITINEVIASNNSLIEDLYFFGIMLVDGLKTFKISSYQFFYQYLFEDINDIINYMTNINQAKIPNYNFPSKKATLTVNLNLKSIIIYLKFPESIKIKFHVSDFKLFFFEIPSDKTKNYFVEFDKLDAKIIERGLINDISILLLTKFLIKENRIFEKREMYVGWSELKSDNRIWDFKLLLEKINQYQIFFRKFQNLSISQLLKNELYGKQELPEVIKIKNQIANASKFEMSFKNIKLKFCNETNQIMIISFDSISKSVFNPLSLEYITCEFLKPSISFGINALLIYDFVKITKISLIKKIKITSHSNKFLLFQDLEQEPYIKMSFSKTRIQFESIYVNSPIKFKEAAILFQRLFTIIYGFVDHILSSITSTPRTDFYRDLKNESTYYIKEFRLVFLHDVVTVI